MTTSAKPKLTEHPIRRIAALYSYEGPNTGAVLKSLLSGRFTGPITLHCSVGRVAAVEWREKETQAAETA